MLRLRFNCCLVLCLVMSCASLTSHAEDSAATRQAAMERYLRAVPMTKLMEDTYSEMAKQLPSDQRSKFISGMRQIVRVESIERIAKAAMLKHFTTAELNALADFYSSKDGASAVSKFGVYTADVMPLLQQEIQRAVQEFQRKGEK